jgi:hypothetical protein
MPHQEIENCQNFLHLLVHSYCHLFIAPLSLQHDCQEHLRYRPPQNLEILLQTLRADKDFPYFVLLAGESYLHVTVNIVHSYGNATKLSHYIVDELKKFCHFHTSSSTLTIWYNFNVKTVILWGIYVVHNNKIIKILMQNS